MLYQLIRPLVTAGIKAYFKRISVIGSEHLDGNRTLFVCNHPSALFDPIVVAVLTKKPLHFLAGAEWFGKGIQRWVFESQFNMIPVYRPWLAEDKGAAKPGNEGMFVACYLALDQKKRIIIFPEASSVTVPWIRDIKTGAARIKLGADSIVAKGEKVNIVPIGINYTNPHRFQTSVFVKVGEPIDFVDLQSSIQDEKELVRQMTDRIKAKMGECLFYSDNEEALGFVKDVKRLMTETLKSELGVADGDLETEFQIRKGIVREIETKLEVDPQEVESIAKRLRSYINKYESLGFRQYNAFEESVASFSSKVLGVILGFPFFIVGSIINLPPFLVTRWVYNKFFLSKVTTKDAQGQLNSAFAGSLGFSTGLVVFLVWYGVLLGLVASAIPWWLGMILLAALGYLCGRFAMVYYKWIVQISKYVRWHRFRISKPAVLSELLKERQELINDLLAMRVSKTD